MSVRRRGGPKPLDVGNGIVCASFGTGGAWLSLGTVHHRHGFVELSGLPPFAEGWRGSADLVRRFRGLMTDDRYAFLRLEISSPLRLTERQAMPGTRPGHVARHHGHELSIATHSEAVGRALIQQIRVRAPPGMRRPEAIRLLFRGTLDRPALAEITEVTPPAPTGAGTVLRADGSRLRVIAAELPAEALVVVDGAPDSRWRIEDQSAEMLIPWPPSEAGLNLRLGCSLWPGRVPDGATGTLPAAAAAAAAAGAGAAAGAAPPARAANRSSPAAAQTMRSGATLVVPESLRRDVALIRARALRYVVECTALGVGPGQIAILADHRILPLSWTRDAYYQAWLLLTAAATDPTAGDRTGSSELVADHLRWLWLTCDRPTGAWARSHHADGRRKDERFQADQQLYPLLELADYQLMTGRLPELHRGGTRGQRSWSELVSQVLGLIETALSPADMLATEENAADDPVGQPYLVATQILGWHALRRLDQLRDALGLHPRPAELAERIRRAVNRHFPADGPDGRLWAYAVDGRGGRQLYHDANDLPTALAPVWGFCPPFDAAWRGTMTFAFSGANEAYVPGRWGGLGSRHTPGTWSLGLIQEWLARSLVGDTVAAGDALRRLVGVACADGSLPEASDPTSGRVAARHWFAWPGALLAALLAADESGALAANRGA